MTYSYPIVIPPGRNGMQPPDLSLSYSSDDKRQDSIFGYGWSMNLPYIERVNKLGTNNLYNQDRDHTFFTSSFSGELLYIKNTTPVGGSLLGVSQSTPPLSLLEMPENFAVLGASSSTPEEPQISPAPNPVIVDTETARSFHTWNTTPAFVYHPNEWEDWNAARDEAITDAKKPIQGFPVAAEKTKNLSSSFANAKGQTIAAIGSIPKTAQGDYSIEITSMNPSKAASKSSPARGTRTETGSASAKTAPSKSNVSASSTRLYSWMTRMERLSARISTRKEIPWSVLSVKTQSKRHRVCWRTS
jgi:hypothetical protein